MQFINLKKIIGKYIFGSTVSKVYSKVGQSQHYWGRKGLYPPQNYAKCLKNQGAYKISPIFVKIKISAISSMLVIQKPKMKGNMLPL